MSPAEGGATVPARLGGAAGAGLVIGTVVLRVAARPALWGVALGQLARTTGPSWWRRPPFLPLPSRRYAAFRLQTMYGGDGRLSALTGGRVGSRVTAASQVAEDLVGWLTWAAGERAAFRSGRRSRRG